MITGCDLLLQCAVVNVKRGVHASGGSGMSVDEMVGYPVWRRESSTSSGACLRE